MSLWRAYRNLNPKAKAYVGAGLIAWGFLGLQFSDKAGEKLGYTPTEADKAALERLTPSIRPIPKDKS